MRFLKGRIQAGEGVSLPKKIFEESGFKAGDEVKIVITKHGIFIMPERFDLVDLMSGLSSTRRKYDETEYYEQIGGRNEKA